MLGAVSAPTAPNREAACGCTWSCLVSATQLTRELYSCVVSSHLTACSSEVQYCVRLAAVLGPHTLHSRPYFITHTHTGRTMCKVYACTYIYILCTRASTFVTISKYIGSVAKVNPVEGGGGELGKHWSSGHWVGVLCALTLPVHC